MHLLRLVTPARGGGRRSPARLRAFLFAAVVLGAGWHLPLVAQSDAEVRETVQGPPRPFMVERGHADAVGWDSWVAYEYAKVRHLYAARLKLPERTAIDFFDGPHTIHGRGTYEFLHRHLRWPVPETESP